METKQISEFDVLDWISKLGCADTSSREYARVKLREAGNSALPWLVYAYNGNSEMNGEVANIVREIVRESGIPRRGGRAIKRIISAMR